MGGTKVGIYTSSCGVGCFKMCSCKASSSEASSSEVSSSEVSSAEPTSGEVSSLECSFSRGCVLALLLSASGASMSSCCRTVSNKDIALLSSSWVFCARKMATAFICLHVLPYHM